MILASEWLDNITDKNIFRNHLTLKDIKKEE